MGPRFVAKSASRIGRVNVKVGLTLGIFIDREGAVAPNTKRLPSRFPIGSQYVLESCNSATGDTQLVHRYVQFPDGRRVDLGTRTMLPHRFSIRSPSRITATVWG
jgi:hypothetical protein